MNGVSSFGRLLLFACEDGEDEVDRRMERYASGERYVKKDRERESM
jgi:hypothetical protein